MNKAFIGLSVIGVPVSVIGSILQWPSVIMFAIYCFTIISLAGLIGTATESLAIVMGPRIGGLMNATFGNAVELIISFFALKEGLVNIVLASLAGSVIGNLLLVGGLSFFIGGLKYKQQFFNINETQHNSGILFFAVLVAFIIPVVFTENMSNSDTITLSIGISILLIVVYLAALLFKFVTHRGIYQKKGNKDKEKGEEKEEPEWGKGVSITVLAVSTIAVAYVSESLVDTFEVVGKVFGFSELFIGIIIVAIVGNAAEHASAVIMAYKNKMKVALEIAVGSTLQVTMFVLPVLVLISLMFSSPMPLVFTWPELTSMATGVLLVTMISNDGNSNWFDGLILMGAYMIMGIGFYLI